MNSTGLKLCLNKNMNTWQLKTSRYFIYIYETVFLVTEMLQYFVVVFLHV